MLQDKFKTFAIGGVRFSWNFGNYYTHKSDAGQNRRRAQRAPHTTRNVPVQYEPAGRILAKRTRKIPPHALRRRPDRRLRDNIKRASEAKVTEGTMSVTDYMQ